MKRTFEDFLKDWHMKEYTGTADYAPYAFEEWFAKRDGKELVMLADIFGKEMQIRGFKEAAEVVLGEIKKSK